MFDCRVVNGFTERDSIQIIPEYGGEIDLTGAIIIRHGKPPTKVDATKFHNECIGRGVDIVLRIFKNDQDTGASLIPSHFIQFVVISIKPDDNGLVSTRGKLAKNSDFLPRIFGLGFRLSGEYSSRKWTDIPQSCCQVEGPIPAGAMPAARAMERQKKQEQERMEREAARKQEGEEEDPKGAFVRMQKGKAVLHGDDLEKGAQVAYTEKCWLPQVAEGFLTGR